jgi:GLEYA domain
MTLPASGALKFSLMSNVFGVAPGPVKFSQYFSGASSGYDSNATISASGLLDFNTFHGKTNIRISSLTIPSGKTSISIPLSWTGANMNTVDINYNSTTISGLSTSSTFGSYTLSGLSANTTYSINLVAYDKNNNACLPYKTSATTLNTIDYTLPGLTNQSFYYNQVTFSIGSWTATSQSTPTYGGILASSSGNTLSNLSLGATPGSVTYTLPAANTQYKCSITIGNLSLSVYNQSSYTGPATSITSLPDYSLPTLSVTGNSSTTLTYSLSSSAVVPSGAALTITDGGSVNTAISNGSTSVTVNSLGANSAYTLYLKVSGLPSTSYFASTYNNSGSGVKGTTSSTLTSVYIDNVTTSSYIVHFVGAFTSVSVDYVGSGYTSSVTITGMSPNWNYGRTVRSYNSAGQQGDTANVSATTLSTIGVASVSVTCYTASVTFNGSFSYVQISGIGGNQGSSYTFSGLNANQYYSYTATSFNSANASGSTTGVSFTTWSLPTASISESNPSTSTIDISWSGSFDHAYISGPNIGNTYNGGGSTTISGLGTNTQYTFTITPYNSAGEAGSNSSVSGWTLPTVSGVYVSGTSASSVSISWNGGGYSYVNIYNNTYNSWAATNQTGTSFTVSSLYSYYDYSFTVYPVGSGGTGPGSTVTATTNLPSFNTSPPSGYPSFIGVYTSSGGTGNQTDYWFSFDIRYAPPSVVSISTYNGTFGIASIVVHNNAGGGYAALYNGPVTSTGTPGSGGYYIITVNNLTPGASYNVDYNYYYTSVSGKTYNGTFNSGTITLWAFQSYIGVTLYYFNSNNGLDGNNRNTGYSSFNNNTITSIVYRVKTGIFWDQGGSFIFLDGNNDTYTGNKTIRYNNTAETYSNGITLPAQTSNFAFSFRGYFVPPTSGTWIFELSTDDVACLWIDTAGANTLYSSRYVTAFNDSNYNILGWWNLNNVANIHQTNGTWYAQGPPCYVTLQAGQYYPILINWSQGTGGYSFVCNCYSPNNYGHTEVFNLCTSAAYNEHYY